MNKHLAVASEELALFCQQNQIRVLSLFGSAVTDKFTDQSDIDLLVEFEPDAKVGFLALARMQRELAAMFERPVDLVPRNGLKSMIRSQVLAQAQDIYAVR